MPMCEGVVDASLQTLFHSLQSDEIVNFALQCGVEADQIKGMEKQVSKLLPVISDAEANQLKSNPVREWLAELKDVVYDAEDVLDLFQTELLRCKLKQSDSPSPSHTDWASPLQVLSDPSTSSVTSLNDKIKQINARLEAIVRRGLKKRKPGTWAGESSEPRSETSPLVNEPCIYGRDRDADKLIELLLSPEPCNENVGVIPIVGQAGIGKTTLAQRLLSEEDCFKLLKRHASIQNLDAQPALERIGKEIARKCKGLPLAAKALGGVLRSKPGEVEWMEILNSEIWDLETELGPALWLSYHYLPAHLKRCFVYSGIIPKDYEFSKEKLIRLWMAEGLLEQKAENHKERMEDIGEGYFCELVSRSFFQQSSEYYSSKFVMHDLINDLARAVSGETCLTMDKEKKWEKLICEKTRHFSHWMEIPKSEAFYRADKLRTYASLETYSSYEKSLFNDPDRFEMKPESLLRLVCLRVLCLNACRMRVLPESISNLVHLRYLDLSDTSIETLPESINALCNLQTLLLQRCESLKELHINTGKLINLRCLDLEGCSSLQKMPRGIGRLKELQMLTYFIVDENNDIGIEELTNLEHLRGMLEISGLQAIRDPIHTFKINLRNKQHLHTLKLKWDDSDDSDDSDLEIDSRAKSVAELVLDQVQLNANLERLKICGYYGTCLPSWLMDPSCYLNLAKREEHTSLQYHHRLTHLQVFPTLKHISIEDCRNLESFPEELFLLPSLEHLKIKSCYSLNSFSRRDSRCSSSTIAIKITKLRRIVIEDCHNLESLPESLHKLTSLESLKIHECSRLRSLPDQMHRLCCLEELRIFKCPLLVLSRRGLTLVQAQTPFNRAL